jgi:hypothetical protein
MNRNRPLLGLALLVFTLLFLLTLIYLPTRDAYFAGQFDTLLESSQ